MEKVILTPKQAKAFEKRKPLDADRRTAMVEHHINSGWTHENNKPLNDLSLDELIRALYIGYEVSQSYEAGDFVVNGNGTVGRIKMVRNGIYTGIWFTENDINFPMECGSGAIDRLATSEEITHALKREKMEKKLDEILTDLSEEERSRLLDKLNC